jgi:signal peptide peptidase SppA
MGMFSFLNPFRRRDPVIGVVRLSGVIGGSAGPMRQGLTLESQAEVIEAAFTGKRITAVALVINSPGGSPVQSDLLQQRIRELSRKHDKPVFAFCEDVVASGGYWLALAADEIYANPSSIIGSIGVISSGFGLEGVIEKLGISRRLHATGRNKGMLDPFSPEDPAHVERLKALQDDMFERFKDWVRERRGRRLTGDEAELFSGAFWTGRKALEFGLIDSLGEMRSVMRDRFGKDVQFRRFGRRPPLLRRLGIGRAGGDVFEDLPGALLASVEERLWWSRYGL